jgi:hypothetical protein
MCRLKGENNEEGQDDLFEEKRSVEEFGLLCLNTLTAEKAFTTDWRVK